MSMDRSAQATSRARHVPIRKIFHTRGENWPNFSSTVPFAHAAPEATERAKASSPTMTRVGESSPVAINPRNPIVASNTDVSRKVASSFILRPGLQNSGDASTGDSKIVVFPRQYQKDELTPRRMA